MRALFYFLFYRSQEIINEGHGKDIYFELKYYLYHIVKFYINTFIDLSMI